MICRLVLGTSFPLTLDPIITILLIASATIEKLHGNHGEAIGLGTHFASMFLHAILTIDGSEYMRISAVSCRTSTIDTIGIRLAALVETNQSTTSGWTWLVRCLPDTS